jgi:hypothetical protein
MSATSVTMLMQDVTSRRAARSSSSDSGCPSSVTPLNSSSIASSVAQIRHDVAIPAIRHIAHESLPFNAIAGSNGFCAAIWR